MKRFWKLLSLVLITLVAISTFYIQSTASTRLSFQVGMKDIEGNRQVLEDAVIAGSIHSNNFGHPFNLNQDRVEFHQDDSYFDKLDNAFERTDTIQRYHEKYRHFMRGKIDNPENYHEDDNSIVYAKDRINHQQINQQYNYTQTIEISRLNKETNETEDFSYSPQLDEDSHFFYVRDVYYDGQLMTILIQQPSYSGETDIEEFRLYTWNFDTEIMDVEGKKVPFSLDSQNAYIQPLPHSTTSEQAHHIGFIAHTGGLYDESDTADESGDASEYDGEVADEYTHFFVFDYKTLEMTHLETSAEIAEAQDLQGLITEDAIYLYKPGSATSLLFADLTADKPVLTPLFTGADEERDETENTDLHEEENLDTIYEDNLYAAAYSFAEIYDNKLYFVSSSDEAERAPVIDVFDLDTQEKLYSGSLEVNQKDRQSTAGQLEVFINNLYFIN